MNHFSLNRKFKLLKNCVPREFDRFICEMQKFMYLNRLNVLHPKTTQLVQEFVKGDPKNLN